MPEIGFVNGNFMPLEEAVVPVEDRGFQFSDGVYEVIRTYNGRTYAVSEHMERLKRSLRELRIALDVDAFAFPALIEEGISRGGYTETLIYIQVTRGTAPRYHAFPKEKTEPTVVMTFRELHPHTDSFFQNGVTVISTRDLRWGRCDIKTVSLLGNVLAKQEAVEAGAFEALLVNDQGQVTEGSSSTFFFVRSGEVFTTPLHPQILPSITRNIVIDLAAKLDIPVHEEYSRLEEYFRADEVFVAGTGSELVGVIEIDKKTIGDGKPGPVTEKLRSAYFATTK